MIRDGTVDTLGKRICYLRKLNNLTQEELADRLCVKKSTISMYENDKVDIKGSILVELSRTLNTSPNYLLGMESVDEESLEIINTLRGLKNSKMRRVAIDQIKALSTI